MVDGFTRAFEEGGYPSSGHDSHGLTILGFYTPYEPVDQFDVSKENPSLHRRNRVLADHLGGLLDGDTGQLGGRFVQRAWWETIAASAGASLETGKK